MSESIFDKASIIDRRISDFRGFRFSDGDITIEADHFIGWTVRIHTRTGLEQSIGDAHLDVDTLGRDVPLLNIFKAGLDLTYPITDRTEVSPLKEAF